MYRVRAFAEDRGPDRGAVVGVSFAVRAFALRQGDDFGVRSSSWISSKTASITTPNKLPFDHHELIAMVAPRAFLAIESSAIARMGAEAARVDALAARMVWAALGEPHRMGASEENVNHCVWHDGYTRELEAYVDKFLLGKQNVNTDILRSKFTIDEATWIPWAAPSLQ